MTALHWAMFNRDEQVAAALLQAGARVNARNAAGLTALVMDVKVGNGAFCTTPAEADALARSLVQTARGAGLPTL